MYNQVTLVFSTDSEDFPKNMDSEIHDMFISLEESNNYPRNISYLATSNQIIAIIQYLTQEQLLKAQEDHLKANLQQGQIQPVGQKLKFE
jgi:hypothetical protein